MNEVAELCQVSRKTVSALWKEGRKQVEDGSFPVSLVSKRKKSGRKRKNFAENFEKIKGAPLNQRSTL